RWSDIAGFVTTTEGPPSSTALRHMQKQVLEKAMSALEEIPPELRDQSSMTMAVNSGRMDEAKVKIKRFRRQLVKFLQEKEPLDEVYQLSVAFFPLTQLGTKRAGYASAENDA